MFLIRFLLIGILVAALLGGLILTFVLKQFKQTVRQFRQPTAERSRRDRQTVEDRRNPHEANKKIIPKEEGEYVDFEEEE